MNVSQSNYSESERKPLPQSSIKGTLVNNGRCPKCTLKPPCKHYASMEELNADVGAKSPVGGLPPKMPKPSDTVMDNLLKAGTDPVT